MPPVILDMRPIAASIPDSGWTRYRKSALWTFGQRALLFCAGEVSIQLDLMPGRQSHRSIRLGMVSRSSARLAAFQLSGSPIQ